MKREDQLISGIENIISDQTLSITLKYSEIENLINDFKLRKSNILTDIEDIKIFICDLAGCKVEDLESNSRKKEIANSRSLLFLIFVNYLNFNLYEAGKLVNRDHAMYYWYLEKNKSSFKYDKEYSTKFKSVIDMYGESILKSKY